MDALQVPKVIEQGNPREADIDWGRRLRAVTKKAAKLVAALFA